MSSQEETDSDLREWTKRRQSLNNTKEIETHYKKLNSSGSLRESTESMSSENMEKDKKKDKKSKPLPLKDEVALLQSMGLQKQYDSSQFKNDEKVSVSSPKGVILNPEGTFDELIVNLNKTLDSMGAAKLSAEEAKFLMQTFSANKSTRITATDALQMSQRIKEQPPRRSSIAINQELTRRESKKSNDAKSKSEIDDLKRKLKRYAKSRRRYKDATLELKAANEQLQQSNQKLSLAVEELEKELDAIQDIETQYETVVQKKNKHKERSKALTAEVAKLQEANEQLDTELKELKVKHETLVKQHDSEISYQKRRATQTSDGFSKQLVEANRTRAQLEQEIQTLKKSMDEMKQQLSTAMNADARDVSKKLEAEMNQLKQTLLADKQQIQASFDEEVKQKFQLKSQNEELEKQVNELKTKIAQYDIQELQVAEVKKKAFSELQNVKGQALLEIKKLKKQIEEEKEKNSRLIVQLNETPTNKPEPPSSSPPTTTPPVLQTDETPPPPPSITSDPIPERTRKPTSVTDVKLRAVRKATLRFTPMEQDTVANMLAYAIVSRRSDIKEDVSDEDEPDWESD